MNTRTKRYSGYLVMGLIAALAATLLPTRKEEPHGEGPRDYEAIRSSGLLRAVTEYNSLSYHLDGDTIAGFQYEMVHAFARSKGLRTEITPLMSLEERLKGVEEGRFDLIACELPTTSRLKDTLALTRPLFLNRQVLVQRKQAEGGSTYIASQLGLAGKTLNVIKGSPAILRIHNLSDEIGDSIHIREIEDYGQEQLLAMVAHGDIDYAVCDESIARAFTDSLPQLDIHTAIGFTQFYAWGVSKQSPVLLDSLNAWIEAYTQSREFRRIHQKYYKN